MIRLRSCRSASCCGVFPSRPREQSVGSMSTFLFLAIFVTVLMALWRMAMYSSELYQMSHRSFSEKRSRLEISFTRTLRLKSTFFGGQRSSSVGLGESERWWVVSLEQPTEVVLSTEDDPLLVTIEGLINMDRAFWFVDDRIIFRKVCACDTLSKLFSNFMIRSRKVRYSFLRCYISTQFESATKTRFYVFEISMIRNSLGEAAACRFEAEIQYLNPYLNPSLRELNLSRCELAYSLLPELWRLRCSKTFYLHFLLTL